jgi:enoyl-CoA hydratase/carnithine racemase
MSGEIVRSNPAAHVACLTLSHPSAANAITTDMLQQLDDALGEIESDDDVRAWILTGAPRSDGRLWFSAGRDYTDAGRDEPGAIDPVTVVDRIDDLLKPSIAAIEGFCTTGGLELVLACDIRVAGRSARLSDWHLKRTGLGLGAWGVAARLSRLVGTDKAKELLLLSAEVDGAEAERIGLVNRAVDDGTALDAAVAMASTIAEMPRAGVRTTLGYLAIQEDMSKREAIHTARLWPALSNLTLRPFTDAAARFARQKDAGENSEPQS